MAALTAAAAAGHIDANPAAGTRLPRDEPTEMVFLECDQYRTLLAEIAAAWKPLVEFLVASGARWSEATALKPSDVDRARGTVRITRAWKRSPYRIGPTKTRKSVRTINVATTLLEHDEARQRCCGEAGGYRFFSQAIPSWSLSRRSAYAGSSDGML